MSNSNTQCHNCRKRRIKCDSARPTCRKCSLKGLECLGYGKQKPLVWLQDGGYQNQYLSEGSKPPSQRKPRKSGRPRLVVAKDEKDEDRSSSSESESALVQTNPPVDQPSPDTLHIPEILDVKYPMNVKLVVSSLWYFYEKIDPDLNPFLRHRTLPTLETRSWQDDITNLFLCLIVPITATHKAVQSQEANGVIFLNRDVYKYKYYVLRRLNQELRDPKAQLDDLTLLCVLTLQMAEFQQSATGNWFAHFEGAKKMIELKGGLKLVSFQKPFLRSILRYFMATDILSLTTASTTSVQEAHRQLEYSSFLDELFCDGAETCVPFPNDLVNAVIQINYLRTLLVHSICDDSSGISFAACAQTLLQTILSFSETEWAERKASEYGTSTAVTTTVASGYMQPVLKNWLQIASVFHSAVTLYAIRALALDIPSLFLVEDPLDPTSPQISIERLHETTRETLFHDLRTIYSSQKEDQKILRKTLVWPVFIAGVEAGDDEDAVGDREFVTSCLHALSIGIGSLNLRDAGVFLKCYWDRNESRGYPSSFYDRRRWDEVFEGVHERCAFFM